MLLFPNRSEVHGFYGEVVEFVEAIRAGRRPVPSVAEVAHSMKVCEMIQKGKSGRVG